MTDKERVEHILRRRLEYTGRGNYRDGIKNEIELRLEKWIEQFDYLGLLGGSECSIVEFYINVHKQSLEREHERKERKRKGYERLCKRLHSGSYKKDMGRLKGIKRRDNYVYSLCAKIKEYERVNNIK